MVWPGALMYCSFLIPDDIAKSLKPAPCVRLYRSTEQMICLRSTYHVSNCGNKELHCFMLSLRPGYYFILKIGISVLFSKEGHLCDFAHKAS